MTERKSSKMKPQLQEANDITNKVVFLIITGALTFLGSSFASRHYVDERIDAKQKDLKTKIESLESKVQNINLSLKGIKKDTCYTRRSIAKLAGEKVPACHEQ